jgi:hypothetical protein
VVSLARRDGIGGVEAGERDMTLATMRGMCDLMKKETARLKQEKLAA